MRAGRGVARAHDRQRARARGAALTVKPEDSIELGPDLAATWSQSIPDSFNDVVPDLAVEVLSPADSNRQILDRVGEFLQAGVRMVWIVDPRRSRAAVYRTLTDVEQVDRDGWIDGGQVVRGFRDVLA